MVNSIVKYTYFKPFKQLDSRQHFNYFNLLGTSHTLKCPVMLTKLTILLYGNLMTTTV